MTALTIKSFDGLAIYAEAQGPASSPAVVLSHSIGCDHSMWAPQVAALASRYRVVCFDRRGHGRSGVPQADATVATLAADVLAVMDAFGLRRADFVGLSQGGMEGMWLAAREPGRIRRLVLANTTPYLGAPDRIQDAIDMARAQGTGSVGNGFLDRWLPLAYREAHPAQTAAMRHIFASMSPQGFAACAAVLKLADLRPELPRIVAPTLVIVGGEEGEALQAAAQGLAQGIANARLAVIPGAGHLSSVDQPEAFNSIVGDFLDN